MCAKKITSGVLTNVSEIADRFLKELRRRWLAAFHKNHAVIAAQKAVLARSYVNRAVVPGFCVRHCREFENRDAFYAATLHHLARTKPRQKFHRNPGKEIRRVLAINGQLGRVPGMQTREHHVCRHVLSLFTLTRRQSTSSSRRAAFPRVLPIFCTVLRPAPRVRSAESETPVRSRIARTSRRAPRNP